MRKSAVSFSGISNDKVYCTSNLEVNGKKKPLSVPERHCTVKTKTSKPVFDKAHFFIQEPRQKGNVQPQSTNCNKNVLKTAVKEYTNSEVSNKLLRQIREASKAADFERILQSLCQGNIIYNCQGSVLNKNVKLKDTKVLEDLEAEELYEEFFGKHFDYLASIAATAKPSADHEDSDYSN